MVATASKQAQPQQDLKKGNAQNLAASRMKGTQRHQQKEELHDLKVAEANRLRTAVTTQNNINLRQRLAQGIAKAGQLLRGKGAQDGLEVGIENPPAAAPVASQASKVFVSAVRGENPVKGVAEASKVEKERTVQKSAPKQGTTPAQEQNQAIRDAFAAGIQTKARKLATEIGEEDAAKVGGTTFIANLLAQGATIETVRAAIVMIIMEKLAVMAAAFSRMNALLRGKAKNGEFRGAPESFRQIIDQMRWSRGEEAHVEDDRIEPASR